MKFSKLPRLYFASLINDTSSLITLEGCNFQYLVKVLRLKKNDFFRIFNKNSGEYLAHITQINKKSLECKLTDQLREAESKKQATLTLALAIIKSNKMNDAINVATQLGVDNIIPTVTSRSQQKHINIGKSEKIIIESTEQSERISPPILHKPQTLESLIKHFDIIIYANENEHDKTLTHLENIVFNAKDITLLVGPEGGFTDEELELLQKLPNAHSITLGNNVLRSEIAVCAILAQIQLRLIKVK